MPTRLQQPAHEGQIIRNMFLPEVHGAVGLKFAEVGRALRARLDLVVEVLSPWDRQVRLRDKMEDYFSSGARLVWVINPGERNAVVYRTPEADRLLRVTDALDGEDLLPGFRLPLAELFAELSFE